MIFEIRLAVRRDNPEIHRIEQLAFLNPWSLEEIRKFPVTKNQFTMVACIDEQIVGFMFYAHHQTHVIIHQVATDPEFAGLGVARDLVNNQTCRVGHDKPRKVVKTFVPDTNFEALKFFVKLGFRATSLESGDHGNPDYYIMQCRPKKALELHQVNRVFPQNSSK